MSRKKKTETEKCNEVVKLKMQLGGYKTSNENYKHEITGLKGQLQGVQTKYDNLYLTLAETKQNHQIALDEKDRIISGLRDQFNEVSNRLVNTEKHLHEAISERDRCKSKYEDLLRLPWYKRIFVKE